MHEDQVRMAMGDFVTSIKKDEVVALHGNYLKKFCQVAQA
jgi:hypothetical protein